MTPLRTASMKPTSMMGTVAVRRNCDPTFISFAGRGVEDGFG
jgi:hypothetical protein